jgi:hypothetical protein
LIQNFNFFYFSIFNLRDEKSNSTTERESLLIPVLVTKMLDFGVNKFYLMKRVNVIDGNYDG